jgi:hypothetical protein
MIGKWIHGKDLRENTHDGQLTVLRQMQS